MFLIKYYWIKHFKLYYYVLWLYDEYKRGLDSIIYKFFNDKSSGGGI